MKNIDKFKNWYRGKLLSNGAWVYGQVIENDHRAWIVDVADAYPKNDFPVLTQFLEVDKSTVCQYTGMYDKTGTPIFERDIVEFDDTPYSVYGSHYKGEVRFSCGKWCVCYHSELFGHDLYKPLHADDFANRKTVVLGNTYDNYDLWEEINGSASQATEP